MKKGTKVLCVKGENIITLTNGKVYETYKDDTDQDGLMYVTDDKGARVGFFAWRFDVLSGPAPVKDSSRKWNFNAARLLSIDWNLIASEISSVNPVAFVTSTEQLSKKQLEDAVEARSIFFVLIHESIHQKAAACNIPLPANLGFSLNRAENTTVSRIADGDYGDAMKWVRTVKKAKWPKEKNISSSVNVVLPVI